MQYVARILSGQTSHWVGAKARPYLHAQLTSHMGQKQTSRFEIAMSALPPKADIAGRQLNVRFVPKADILASVT
jgi:hypothetical protein